MHLQEDFDAVMRLVSKVLKANPAAHFLMTYQQRSSRRTLLPYLDRYSLQAKELPLEFFLHPAHRDGFIVLEAQRREQHQHQHRNHYYKRQKVTDDDVIERTSLDNAESRGHDDEQDADEDGEITGDESHDAVLIPLPTFSSIHCILISNK